MRPTDVAIQAFRPFRMRQLESLLIVVAIALGVGVVTAMLALTLNSFEQEQKLHDSLSARELTMLSRDDDYEAFLRGMIF